MKDDVFDEVVAWFISKNIRIGNPETIHEDFSARQK